MEKPTKNLIKFTKTDIESSLKKNSLIEEYNKKLQLLRTNQIFKSIKESTDIRNEMLRKLKGWVTMLEGRIFDPQTIADLDINKVISLFEYLGSFSLSMFKQTGDMDQLLKSYTDSQNAKEALTNISKNKNLTEDQEQLKGALMKSFLESLVKKSEEITAIPVTSEKVNIVVENTIPEKNSLEEPKEKSPSEEGDIPDLTFEDEDDEKDNAVTDNDGDSKVNKEVDDSKIDVDLE